MHETDFLRRRGILFTNKQYKKCLFILVSSLILSGLICLAGGIILIISNTTDISILGGVLFVTGFIMLLISCAYSFKYAAKIQTYLHYKKHPEDFDNKIKL